jgi:DNA-binding NarL/FixJ family response regulator
MAQDNSVRSSLGYQRMSSGDRGDRRIRVVIGDDSYLIREAIQQFMTGTPRLELVATCADGDEVRDAVERLRPDVVVTDMRMPPSGNDEGMRVSEWLRTQHPSVGVVILTQHDDPKYGRALVTHGAEGRAYLLKDRIHSRRELISAIELVAHGGSAIDPHIVAGLMASPGTDEAGSALASLTPREREVLTLMAEGRSNAAIAQELVLTRHAVEKYVGAIFEKLGLDDEQVTSRRVAAVLRYLDSMDA